MSAPDPTASIIREARAKIMWGDDADAVLAWMVESGVEDSFADQVVQTAVKERAFEARAQGIKELIVGGILMVISPIPAVYLLYIGFPSMVLFTGCGLGFSYGLIRFIKGVSRLLQGARFSGAVSDL